MPRATLAMDPRPLRDSSPHQLPQSLPESALQEAFDTCISADWLSDEPADNSNALADFYFCSSEPTSLDWSQWGLEAQDLIIPEEQRHSVLQPSELSQPQRTEDTADQANIAPLSNVSQWLDGAYRPPVPCTHCRRHRLQCLIIRTTPANPNPITSCSSCVALFRECSLSKGEKRQPSRFETFSPVLGHLHGLPEQMEDCVSIQSRNVARERLTLEAEQRSSISDRGRGRTKRIEAIRQKGRQGFARVVLPKSRISISNRDPKGTTLQRNRILAKTHLNMVRECPPTPEAKTPVIESTIGLASPRWIAFGHQHTSINDSNGALAGLATRR